MTTKDDGGPIRLVYRNAGWRDVPERWAKQYAHYPAHSRHQEIARELAALPPEARTPETMSAIIGNTSWTELLCDVCGVDHAVLVRIGAEPDYDMRWQDVCATCIDKAALLAARARQGDAP
jgi:hypothetical protein